MANKGSWHCSRGGVEAYTCKVVFEELTASGKNTAENTYTPKGEHHQFLGGVNASVTIPEIELLEEFQQDFSVCLTDNFQDKIIKSASFLDTTHNISMKVDRVSMLMRRNFIVKEYGPPSVNDNRSFKIESQRIIIPLSLPFSFGNDFSYPLIYGDDGRCCKFKVSIDTCPLQNIIEIYDRDGKLVPFNPKMFFKWKKTHYDILLRADLRTECEESTAIHRSNEIIPRDIHMPIITYYKTEYMNSGAEKTFDIEDFDGKLLGIMWVIERENTFHSYSSSGKDPLKSCTLQNSNGEEIIFGNATPEELRDHGDKLCSPYIRKGLYCIPLVVKMTRKHSCNPLSGTDLGKMILKMSTIEGDDKYVIRIYVMIHKTLNITRSSTKFKFVYE